MTKKNSLEHAPYLVDQAGRTRLLEYDPYGPGADWRPNDPFEATLVLVDYERGRSAARFVWHDQQTDTRYPMFMSGMLDLVKNHSLHKGRVTATWQVVKRGQNYGLEAL